jgi:hypothetical protein
VDASAGAARLPNGGASLLGRLYAGALPLHPHTDDATGGVIDYLRTQWGTDHLAASNPHGQYLTTIPSEYLTQDEGDLRYLPLSYVPPASGISQADADLRYVNTAGDTMTGALTVQGPLVETGNARYEAGTQGGTIYMDGPDSVNRGFSLQTNGANRWGITLEGGFETGSNAGGNLQVYRFGDAGTYLGTALTLSRATGAATFGGAVGVPSLTVGGVAVSGAGLATDPLANAKGDVFAASANDAVGRLALGPDGHVLTADGAQALGVKWAAPGAGGSFLPTAGGTLTGPVTSTGADVLTGGALTVTAGVGADARGFGPTSPAYTPGLSSTFETEAGQRVSLSAPAVLVAVRWYRAGAQPAPAAVRFWDATAPATPLLTVNSLPEFADAAVGWKEHRLTGAEQRSLVTGRNYVVSWGWSSLTDITRQPGYAPVGAAPVVFGTFVNGGTNGAYPGTTSTLGYGIDLVVQPVGVAAAAGAGAVRLPNAGSGALAWRNAANTADLSLSMDASDRLALTVGSGSLTTTATAGAASALPGVPAGYLTAVLNGTAVKLAYWAV